MARNCKICGRGTQVGNNRSWSKRATKRKFKINLQWVNVGFRILACSKCRRTLFKAPLVKKAVKAEEIGETK